MAQMFEVCRSGKPAIPHFRCMYGRFPALCNGIGRVEEDVLKPYSIFANLTNMIYWLTSSVYHTWM